MPLETAVQPVILLGMHRSGTAMIARLLDQLGLFQGHELQEDHESVWFMDINDLLLRRVNAAWDHPGPINSFMQNPAAFDLTLRCLADDLTSKRNRQFLGFRRGMEHKSLLKYNLPWGWKDPRTLFTLPLWLNLFPQAKFIYIVRNGIDVAKSLMAREQRELTRRIAECDGKSPSRHRSKLQRAGFKGSARCLTLEGGFSLWEQYVDQAERTLAEAKNDRLIVSYEKFVADPAGHLSELAKFCEIDADENSVSTAIARVPVNAARANAFAADPAVAEFHERVRQTRWMLHYGYGR